MPALSQNATTFRRGQYAYTGYLSTIPQTVVLSGVITAVPTYPALTLTYTKTGGEVASVTQDMTVKLYSSAGVPKGTLRIASGASASSTSLPVNEFSAGTYNVVSGDTFEVISEYRIFDRLVSATAALNKDSRIAAGNYGYNQPPVANSGGPYAGKVSGGVITVGFYGSTSFAVDPDSNGTLTHEWTFPGGTPSTSSSANPTGISFPPGFRWVKHVVTDMANANATTQYVPVWAHDDGLTNSPLAVQMEGYGCSDPASGWRATFRLPKEDQSSLDNLPDGALVVYWEDETYFNTNASYGANVTGRSHIKFSGYLIRDTISIDPDTSEVVFEAVSPLAILAQTPALPQLLISVSNLTTNWQEQKALTTKKILAYLSYWHATLQDAWDFVWTDGLDLAYSRIAIDGNNSIADQLRDVANSLNVDLTCDRLGRLQFVRDPNFLSSVERASRTTTYDFTTADLMRVEITREHTPSTKFVRGEGITTTSQPVFSNAPGNAPAPFGISSDTLAKQIVSSQSDLNSRTGYHFARVNGLYNGRIVPKGTRITLPDGYDVFDPAHREFVTLTLPATTNTRGVSFDSTERWTVESVEIGYDIETGSKNVSLTIDHETTGAAGVTYIPPQENENGLLPFPDFDLQFPGWGVDLGIPRGLISGTTTIAAFFDDSKFWITTNFDYSESAGGPTWAATDLAAMGMSGSLLDFVPDAYSPLYLGTGTAVNGWLATETSIYRITDIFGTVGLTSVHTFGSSSSWRQIQTERGVQNWVLVSSYYSGLGVKVAYSTNGTSFTEVTVTTFADNSAVSIAGVAPIWMSPHTAGKARTVAFTANGTNSAPAAGFESNDYGATWAELTNPDIDPNRRLGFHLEIPYSGSDNVIYYGKSTWTGSQYNFDTRKSVGAVASDIGPNDGVFTYGPVSRRGVRSYDLNANNLMLIGYNNNQASGLAGVWVSRNAGTDWEEVVAPSNGNLEKYVGGNIGGSGQALYVWGTGLYYSPDFGATGLDNRTGNITGGARVLNICGG